MNKTFFTTSLLLLHFMFSGITVLYAQRDSTQAGVMGQALTPARVLAARHEFNNNNMRGALTIYREILDSDPTNATAMYGIAECHYNLKKYHLAKEYLDKAVRERGSISAETELFYGRIHHRIAELDKAIEYYDKYAARMRPGTYEYERAKNFGEQCRFAKSIMAHPVDVTIRNMGEGINTRYEDYTPSISADGKLMVFTSRRSDTQGGAIDSQGDFKFYEDIYYSTYDETTGKWSDSQPMAGEVNTETHDAVLSLVPDATGLFVYKNNGISAGDIFYARYNPEKNISYAAEKLSKPVNTSYYEGSVSMTADGTMLYFISERMIDGLGRGDIYVSEKKGSGWGDPRNIGPTINTDEDEKFVFIHPNGKILFFASEGHQTMGSYDIFRTELVNGEWSTPVNLGYPINTVNEESTFSLTADNKSLLIAAEYDDSFGERDIYQIDVSRYPLISQGYDKSTYGQLVCIISEDKGWVKGAKVQVFDSLTDRLMAELKTDKLGYARVNLLGNTNYKVKVTDGDDVAERDVMLNLRDAGETVQKVEIKLPRK